MATPGDKPLSSNINTILRSIYASLDQVKLHVMLTSDIACTMLVANRGCIDVLLTGDRNPLDVFVGLPSAGMVATLKI